jgi:large subunit ribosomal protein L6
MSRIGRKPIIIPAAVEVTIEGQGVRVKGPKGTLALQVHPLVTVERVEQNGGVEVHCRVGAAKAKLPRALWGTTRALVQNMVRGVTQGYEKSLEIIGVGFRANVQGTKIIFDVGYSHPVEFMLPEGVTAVVEKNVLMLRGIDRQLVGETAARIRRIRKPEPYKGTGIKYTDEIVRRKAGKAGKAGAA